MESQRDTGSQGSQGSQRAGSMASRQVRDTRKKERKEERKRVISERLWVNEKGKKEWSRGIIIRESEIQLGVARAASRQDLWLADR